MEDRSFEKFVAVLIGVFGVIAVVIAVIAAIATIRGGTPVAAASEGEGQEVAPHISLTEFAIDGDLTIPPGEVTIELHNEGGAIHNLAIEGIGQSEDLNGGESTNWAVGALTPGQYQLTCTIAGHAEAGMVANLIVSEEPGLTVGGGHQMGEDPDWAALDAAMVNSILAFPAETAGMGNQLLEPEVLADGTKRFDLKAEIIQWEVEPGKFVDAWTYNGMVPGPWIDLDLGDKIQVVIDNQLPMGTDIHWHGIHTPNDMDGVAPLTQPLIESGQTFTYEFTAEDPAVGMYHAHHHGQMQVPNGMFAVMTIGEVPIPRGRTIGGIDVPADLEIAREIPMVLNDAGTIGFSLNGKSFPATEPYVLQKDDWIMVHYYNEGLQIHPMHQHQFPQLIIAKDGIPLDEPYWADTVNIAPGERYTVILQAEDPGVGVALPHPQPRRTRRRHVRHGDRSHRGGVVRRDRR